MYSRHLTHPKWTHTRSSGQPCYSTRGAVGGSVPCSRTPQSWYWRRILPPPTIPAGPEIRTHNLLLTSPTHYPLAHDCPSHLWDIVWNTQTSWATLKCNILLIFILEWVTPHRMLNCNDRRKKKKKVLYWHQCWRTLSIYWNLSNAEKVIYSPKRFFRYLKCPSQLFF